jgi:hypothetical protein
VAMENCDLSSECLAPAPIIFLFIQDPVARK